jgi:hypothetical protein
MVFLFSNVFFFLRSLALRARSAAAEVVVAQGVEMVVAEGEAETTRRRDDLGDDLGETVVVTAI